MKKSNSRHAEMERYITLALIISVLLFTIFLIASGCGILWLKIISAIFAILIPCLCLIMLYLTKELLRPRSLWMTVGAAAIVICILFSIILNFPSPRPVIASQNTAVSSFSADL